MRGSSLLRCEHGSFGEVDRRLSAAAGRRSREATNGFERILCRVDLFIRPDRLSSRQIRHRAISFARFLLQTQSLLPVHELDLSLNDNSLEPFVADQLFRRRSAIRMQSEHRKQKGREPVGLFERQEVLFLEHRNYRPEAQPVNVTQLACERSEVSVGCMLANIQDAHTHLGD